MRSDQMALTLLQTDQIKRFCRHNNWTIVLSIFYRKEFITMYRVDMISWFNSSISHDNAFCVRFKGLDFFRAKANKTVINYGISHALLSNRCFYVRECVKCCLFQIRLLAGWLISSLNRNQAINTLIRFYTSTHDVCLCSERRQWMPL